VRDQSGQFLIGFGLLGAVAVAATLAWKSGGDGLHLLLLGLVLLIGVVWIGESPAE
jgi:hypothetical protein